MSGNERALGLPRIARFHAGWDRHARGEIHLVAMLPVGLAVKADALILVNGERLDEGVADVAMPDLPGSAGS